MDTAAPMDGWWQQRELFDAARGRPSRCRRKRTKRETISFANHGVASDLFMV